MKKYRTLKFINRHFTPRDWRCHKRRVFFETLFEPLKEIRNRYGDHISGYIQYDESSFTRACHEMAAEISFYPFEIKSYINVGEYLYTEMQLVRIETSTRKSSLCSFLFGFGDYEVEVYDSLDAKRQPINFKYKSRVSIF